MQEASRCKPRATQPAPNPLIVFPENVPAALRSIPHWVVWRYGPPRSRDSKPPKEPIDPRTEVSASPTNPKTWRPFPEAMTAYRSGGYAGIGFVLSAEDPFTALDLDTCRDPDSGLIAPWAQQIINSLNSYTEVSPSSKGIRILVLGKKPGARCRRGRLEMYDRGRYVAISGNHLAGTPETIESRQNELAAVYREHLDAGGSSGAANRARPVSQTDQQVIKKASQCKNGHKFRALFFNGDTSAYSSRSEADLALAGWLAYYCGWDPGQIIRLMKQSALCRPKWNRTDYLERTVAAALAKQQRFYRPSAYQVGPGVSHLVCDVHSGGGGEHMQTKCDNLPPCPIYFSPPTPCRRCSPRKHFLSRTDPNREAAFRPSCRRWNCTSCAEQRKQKHMERLHFGTHGMGLALLYSWVGPRSIWRSLKRTVQRKRGLFMAVKLGTEDDELLVLCTVPIAGSDQIAADQAMNRLAECLKPMRGPRGRVVSYSHRWPKLPKLSNWKCEGPVPATSERLESTLIAEMAQNPGVTGAIWTPGQAAVWQFSGVSEADRARISDRILGHVLTIPGPGAAGPRPSCPAGLQAVRLK